MWGYVKRSTGTPQPPVRIAARNPSTRFKTSKMLKDSISESAAGIWKNSGAVSLR
jgi:hypothetical protein